MLIDVCLSITKLVRYKCCIIKIIKKDERSVLISKIARRVKVVSRTVKVNVVSRTVRSMWSKGQ